MLLTALSLPQYGEGRSGLLVLLQERDLELQKMSLSLREYRESAEDSAAQSRQERSRVQSLQRELASVQDELSRCRQKKGKSEDELTNLERQVGGIFRIILRWKVCYMCSDGAFSLVDDVVGCSPRRPTHLPDLRQKPHGRLHSR